MTPWLFLINTKQKALKIHEKEGNRKAVSTRKIDLDTQLSKSHLQDFLKLLLS